MAGKPKKRIDYAGWSVDIFSNDPKIDKLLDAQGWIGFGIYFYLCQMAFGGEGYYYEWCYDLCATTARKMGGGVGAGTVKETVDYCLQIGLFDKGLFVRWGVLTSRGIQKSYLLVLQSKNRCGTEIIVDFWLLDKTAKEYQGVIFVTKNHQNLEVNSHSLGENEQTLEVNSHSLAQKESKVKDSIKKDIPCVNRFDDFWNAYPKQRNRPNAERAYCKVIMDDVHLTESDLVIAAENYADAISILGTDERYIKNPDRFITDNTFVDYLDCNYKKPSAAKANGAKQNQFNQFPQRDYNFSELEQKLLNK